MAILNRGLRGPAGRTIRTCGRGSSTVRRIAKRGSTDRRLARRAVSASRRIRPTGEDVTCCRAGEVAGRATTVEDGSHRMPDDHRSPKTARSSSTASRRATGAGEGDLFPVGSVVQVAGRCDVDRAARAAVVLQRRSSRARCCSGPKTRTKITDADGNVTTVYYPKPTQRIRRAAARQQPDVRRSAARRLLAEAELPVAHAGAVLRHGVAAAHSDSLLHGEGSGRGPEEHGRRHRVASGSSTCSRSTSAWGR